MNPNAELIRLYAKQLKLPTFAEYAEVLRRADPSADFAELLLELMKAETESRQENQNRRRLKRPPVLLSCGHRIGWSDIRRSDSQWLR